MASTPPGDLQRELEALERVLFRLASADDARLLLVLQSLLPQLLRTFPATTDATDILAQQLQDKVLQVIAHVKTRLQAITNPVLPLRALGQMLREPAVSPLAHTFALMFIDIGFRAATSDEREEVLAEIFKALETHSASQQETFYRLLLRALPVTGNAVYPPPKPAEPLPAQGETADEIAGGTTRSKEMDPTIVGSMEALLDFLLDFVLYDGSMTSNASGSGAGSSSSESATVFGLSIPRLERMQRVVKSEAFTKEQLYAAQLNALRFVKELEIPTKHKVVHYLAGCASFHHSIKGFCEEQLVHVLKHEYVQLEDPQVVRRVIALCLGSHVAQGSGAFSDREQLVLSNRMRFADASILQALTLLSTSKAAANAMPMMLQLLCHLMYGTEPARPPNVANRVKLAGVRLCHWTFIHAESVFVEGFLGPVILPTLLRALMDPNADSDPSQAAFLREFRQGVYDTVKVIGTRAPALVAGSEQAFQVLLVRCLVEEERRTGTGANALKAFTSLSRAYGLQASEATQAKVRSELTDLLRGSRVFDKTKNYARVRAAIATWCGDLLSESESDSNSNIAMRFALLKLCGDPDAEVQTLSRKALYSEPLPTLNVVSTYLRAHYPHRDLKRNIQDARTVESCLRFCLLVLKNAHHAGEMEIADERSTMVEYFVQTLLGKSEASLSGDTAALSGMYEAAASSLVEICAFDKRSVTDSLGKSTSQLLTAACISSDRDFLLHVAALVQYTLEAEDSSQDFVVNEVVQSVSLKLDDPVMQSKDIACLHYVLGSAISVLSASDAALPDDQTRTILAAYKKMTSLLSVTVKTCSHFAGFPRGEEDQNARVDFFRSLLDGTGLSGCLTKFLSNPSSASEWVELKRHSLAALQQILEWDLSGISSDGGLKLKLTKIKYVAVENLSRGISRLPSTTGDLSTLSSSLEGAVDALVKLGNEQDPELQLLIGEALVSIGQHGAGDVSADMADSKITFADNRAAAIFSRLLNECVESRQPNVRRSATTWLLCICAAGLSAPKDIAPSKAAAAAAGASSSWQVLLRSEAATRLLVDTHEFFVTMLNDSNNIAKESAVKGLAYLRLRAPRAELGDQFSDSLFRRLRCFRAFTSSSSSVPGLDAEDADMDSPAPETAPARTTNAPSTSAATTASASSSSSSSSSSSTVENAAYREVSNLAADIGDPELMYALLYLSTTDPIWETLLGSSSSPSSASTGVRRSMLFSFAEVDRVFRLSIIDQAGKLWMDASYTSTNKLVPWLFLLKFHSNPKVSEVMTNLWNFAKGKFGATSSQEKTLLQQHWQAIFKFLLSRVEGSRNFKYREAACVALIDILNGADAEQLRHEFLHLWKLASAAVDDVMEAVCVAGLKLYRYMGELSLRIAANDEACRKILLQYLIADGIVSKNVVCRALGIDVLLRLVKALAAEAIQESLAALIVKLLEYLSSLEMPELQYAQFHVQKKEQLERLRVSISQSGPVGQLLELSTTRLKELAGSDACVSIVDELVRGVANLLRFGVGLNTRVGSANFVVSLAVELPFELRKCRGAELLLAKVFIPFVGSKTSAENDVYGDEESRYGASSGGLADGLVVQAYCRAAAYLCPLVDASLVREYVRTGIFAFNTNTRRANGGADDEGVVESALQRSDANRFLLVSAIATKELVAKVPPIADAASTLVQADSRNDWYCTHVFPGAFIGQFASTEVLKSTWTAVLEELPPSVLYAEASIDATLASIALFIAHTAWDTRKQAALALHALFSSATSSYRTRITAQQTERIWRDLAAAVPGRLWKGKGVILEALVALTSVKPEARESLSILLLRECERAWRNNEMEYLESAVQSFGKLSSQLPAEQWELRLANFSALRSALLVWLGGEAVVRRAGLEDEQDQAMMSGARADVGGSIPPLLIKCVFEALALVWPSTPLESGSAADESATGTILWLCETVTRAEFNVWSIRKAVFEALAAVVATAPATALATPQTTQLVLDKCCGELGVRDAKYSMIRVAAAAGLTALTKRHKAHHELALLLTVHRERISETLEVLRASEEPAEQRAAFQTMTNLLELQE